MDKLSRFYFDLSIDADRLAKFNQSRSSKERRENRMKMMKEAGIENCDKIISLTQSQLLQLLSAGLYSITGDYVDSFLKRLTNS